MTTAFPLNPINTIHTTELTNNNNNNNINTSVATTSDIENLTPTITSNPTHSDEQHHQTTDSKNTHESDHPIDYVHSLVDMTVHTIDSIWIPTQINPNPNSTSIDASAAKKVVDTKTFIKHILRNSRTRHSTLLIAIFYLFRIKPRLFKALETLPIEERRYLLCGRRMFLVALTLAWKYQEDRSPGSKFWSKVSGLPAAQITKAERLFLGLLDYQLHIPKDSYDQWTSLVQRHCGKPHGLPAFSDNPSYGPIPAAAAASSSSTLLLHSPPPEHPMTERRNGDFKRRRRYATPMYQCHDRRSRDRTALLPLPTPPADSFGDSPLKRKWSST